MALLVVGAAAGTVSAVPASATPDATKCAALTAAGNANTKRAYKNDSLINLPVSCQNDAADALEWATRWFTYGRRENYADPTNPSLASMRGEIIMSFREYSTPVYNGTGVLPRRIFGSKNYYNALMNGPIVMPWSPSWKPSRGNDGEMEIVDPATGKEFGLWMKLDAYNWFNGCMFQYAGYNPDYGDLCYAGVYQGTNYVPSGTPPVFDYRHNSLTSDGFSKDAGRGMGALNGLALVPTYDEVKYAVDELKLNHFDNGYVHHALNMETYNTMFGDGTTNANTGCSVAQFQNPTVFGNRPGIDCGYAVAPATRLEHSAPPAGHGTGSTIADRMKTVPEGTHFYLNKSDDDIKLWLAARGLTDSNPKYWTAFVFARTLREYGWFVSDTTNSTSAVSVDSSNEAGKVGLWAGLGINVTANTKPSGVTDVTYETDGYTLLSGLITSASQVGVVEVPTTNVRCQPPGSPLIGIAAAAGKCVNKV